MDQFFKKASLEYFNKLKETSEKIDKLQNNQLGSGNIGSMLQLLEQEIIDLKNQNKTRNMRNNNLDNDDISPQYGNKIDLLIEEMNQLWSFIQRYIDETATDMIMDVRSGDAGFKQKMNRMGWLARNAEFLSPDQITKCLMAFKEQFNGTSVPARTAYITSKHNSNSVITVINLIDLTSKLNRDEENISKLAILLSILEPLLINDLNLEKALEMRTV